MILATAVLLSGCTAPSDDASPSASPETTAAAGETATPTPTPTPASKFPLTGEPLEPGTELNASIASKIDNQSAARPQVGLQYTDIVYEELVEGGLTRYVAVWQSNIPKLYGPVRSIRGMDPAIVSSYGGIITYSGGQPIFVRRIEATDVVNVRHDAIGNGEIFYRSPERAAPHNVIARGENVLKEYGKGVEAPSQQFPFAATLPESSAMLGGTPTSIIKPTFSQASAPSWKWDKKKELWERSQNGVVDKDDKGDQLTAVNVVTAQVTLKTVAKTPVSQLIGSGKASVSSGGKTIQGTWTKKSKKGKLRIVDTTGVPVLLAPGNTWVELVATGGSVKFAE